jgi:hypothetical protein
VEVVVAPVIETVPEPQLRPVDPPALPEIRFPLSSQRRASSAALAVALEAISAQPSTLPNPEAADTPAPPAAQRSHGSSASHAATNFQLRRPPAPASDSRIDWAYFNKDMGDLRDPEPRFRERPRQR